jgi:hypothetical protein
MATGTRASTDVTALDDPALISAWSLARVKVALNPGDLVARRNYAALMAEYRRRLHGAWS